MTTTQYYQITLEELITQYKKGFLNTTGLLFNYIKIKFAPGWRIVLNPKKIASELGITVNSFYKAIAKIKSEFKGLEFKRENYVIGEIETEVAEEATGVAQEKTTVAEVEKVVAKSATEVDEMAKGVAQEAKTEAETTSKISQQSDSPDFSSDSYSKFISNLSQGEREKFLDFCKKRTDSFDIPLKCGLNTFLAAKNKKTDTPYFAEFWDLYQKEGDVIRCSTNDKHTTGMKPDFQKWYYWMKELGIMVKKYDWRGEVGAIDNCGVDKSFEEWLKVYSMEEAKQRYETARGWGR